MKLTDARKLADSLVEVLRSSCDRIEIAGSIRRERPECNDVDLVVVPRFHEVPVGMFETKQQSLVHRAIWQLDSDDIVRVHIAGPKLIRGEFPNRGGFTWDIYIASPETWATLLLIRTGSKEHNIMLCQRAQAIGKNLCADGAGVIDNEKLIQCETEADVFSALCLEYVEPKLREYRS